MLPRSLMLPVRPWTHHGHADQARALAQDWLARHPDDQPMRLRLAALLAAAGDDEAAIAAYQAVLDAGATGAVAAADGLAWLLRERDPARALRLAEQAQQAAPDNAAFADTLASLLLAQGDTARALDLLSAAHATRPTDASITFHYAQALAAAGDNGQARRLLLGLADRRFEQQAEVKALLERLEQ